MNEMAEHASSNGRQDEQYEDYIASMEAYDATQDAKDANAFYATLASEEAVRAGMIASDFDLVDADSGCTCGERRVDSLIWITDDSFRCTTCGEITNVWNH